MKRLLIAVCSLVATAAPAPGAEGGPLAEPYDRSELRTTWRNLGNEQVMYPLDMSRIPVRLGPHRQLLVDNYLIAKARHITRQVHPPKRHEQNPVMAPNRAPLNHIVAQHVLQFDTAPRFRMWYWSWDEWHTLKTGQQIRFATSYAVSDDGVQWRKPALNLYRIEGLNDPNVVLPYGMMHGLFYHPNEPDPQQRFKALVCIEGKSPIIEEGYYLHTSPDGIHWKGDLSRYVIPSLSGYGIPQAGVGDTTCFWWDRLRRKYIGDVKFVLPGKIRCRGVMESDDLVHWTRAQPTLLARSSDAQLYGHRGFAYEGMYIGLRWIFLPRHSRRHSSFVELDCSRDGRIWTRVGAGQPFMALNPKHDTWDATIIRPISLLEVGEELWIYYFGAPSEIEAKNPDLPESHRTDFALGLATLTRDRFVSLNGGERSGTLLTRPLNFTGRTLHVNAEVADGGALTVAILNQDGAPIAGYDHSNCAAADTNGIDTAISWKNQPDIGTFNDSAVRLQFRLHNAKLFSFWIQ